MKILAISGSLRAASINSALLRAVARLVPAGVTVELYGELSNLPLFNPDFEANSLPVVANLFAQISAVDAVLIASPEYAHGITGVLKNALDWIVGSEFFVNKPVALLNASPRATHAQVALRETVSMMSARIIDAACIDVPLLGSGLTEDDIVGHPELSVLLVNVLKSIQAEVIDTI
jgi:NAD(P)H-dependent FMN reductase